MYSDARILSGQNAGLLKKMVYDFCVIDDREFKSTTRSPKVNKIIVRIRPLLK